MVRVGRVDAPLFPLGPNNILGIGNLVFHGGDLELGGCRNYRREPFDEADVRAPDLPLPFIVGGLLLRAVGFGTKSQVFVRRRVGEPARSISLESRPNSLKIHKETTHFIVRWTRVV